MMTSLEIHISLPASEEPDSFTLDSLPLLRRIIGRIRESGEARMKSGRVFTVHHLPELTLVEKALTAILPALSPDEGATSFGARVTDPSTSHDAKLSEERFKQIQEAILQAALDHGAGTEEEFSDWTGVPRPTISPCFRPMIRLGLLVDVIDPATGKRLKRKNRSGKKALVRGLA